MPIGRRLPACPTTSRRLFRNSGLVGFLETVALGFIEAAGYSVFLNRLSKAALASLELRGTAMLGAGMELPFE